MSSAQVTSTLASQAATLRTFERPALVASTPANAGASYIVRACAGSGFVAALSICSRTLCSLLVFQVLDRIGALSSANLSVGKLGFLPIPSASHAR